MRFIVLFAACLSMQIGHGQNQLDVIRWDSKIPLSWADFKGRPSSTYFDASTSTGLKLTWEVKRIGGRFRVLASVESQFFKNRSWKKGHVNCPDLLRHEQLHFAITEYWARILKRKIESLKPGHGIEYRVAKTFKNCQQAMERMQDQYDKESNHSRNKQSQRKWERYVYERL